MPRPLVVVLLLAACGGKNPTEKEARTALAERMGALEKLEETTLGGFRRAGVVVRPPVCADKRSLGLVAEEQRGRQG